MELSCRALVLHRRLYLLTSTAASNAYITALKHTAQSTVMFAINSGGIQPDNFCNLLFQGCQSPVMIKFPDFSRHFKGTFTDYQPSQQ